MIFIVPVEKSLAGVPDLVINMEAVQGYDLIGDVHGCSHSLKQLLEKLGYQKKSGVYRHSKRRAIFLGDLIDRGSGIRETLHLVYDMVQVGAALIVMGNHEFNFLSYCTEGKEGSGKSHLRSHNPRHHRIVAATLEQLINYSAEQQHFLNWIHQMPIYLEFDNFRVVHACWHKTLIKRFEFEYPDHKIDDRFLHLTSHRGTFEWAVIDRLLRGTHLPLPDNEVIISKDGYSRRFFRTKYWLKDPVYYGEVVFQPDPLPEHIAARQLSEQDKQDLLYYAPTEKLLFIGHYWQEGSPAPITSNIACLDYSAVKNGKLTAYRLDNETSIQPDKFVWVDVQSEVPEYW